MCEEDKNLTILTYPIEGNSRSPERRLYITKTHDVSLLSWLEEKKKLDLKDKFFLLTIDNHIDLPDAVGWDYLLEHLKEIKKYNDNEKQLDEIKSNFQVLFRGNDVNFILTAFEIDLLNGCLILSPEAKKEDRIDKLKERYGDKSIYYYPFFSNLFYPERYAILNDRCDPNQKEVCTALKKSNLFIDIDLDYFTYSRDSKRFIINNQHFNWLFDNKDIKTLFIEDATCITITLEKAYCDSENQNNCEIILIG